MASFQEKDLKSFGALPNHRQMEWFARERCIFFHFGMNTFTGKEWGDGGESPSLFNPTDCDVDSWVRVIKEAGFKCAILTAKHHDGFCLWPSKYTEHSVKNSPYKNGQGDIVREFTDACSKYGVKAGIYLSPWDRHEKTWGSPEYNDYYVSQLEELFTNYGKIWECWWDGAGSTEAVYDWERWANTVRSLQPAAVIFGSLGATPWVDVRWVGNEKGVAGEPCYATIDANSLVVENTAELNSGKIGGNRFIPAEVDVSIRPGWFYHSEQDKDVRTPENLMELYFQSVGRGAGLLLNIPPNEKGQLASEDVKAVLDFNSRLEKAFLNDLIKDSEVFKGEEKLENSPLNGELYIGKREKSEFTIVMPEKREINTLLIGEALEYGQKITEIKASACVDGEFKELFVAKSVGYKLIKRFDAVLTDKIKIEITGALDTPILNKLSAYLIKEEKAEEKKRTKINPKIKIAGNVAEIELGGIYKFDTITGDNVGEQGFSVYLFNGTSYDLVKTGKSMGLFYCKLDTPSEGAYRLKIVFDEKIEENKMFELE